MPWDDQRTCGCERLNNVYGQVLYTCPVCMKQASDYLKIVADLPDGVWYNGYVDRVTGQVVVEHQKEFFSAQLLQGPSEEA